MESDYWRRHWNRRLARRSVLAGGAAMGLGIAGLAAGCGDDDDDNGGGGDVSPTAGGGQASPGAASPTTGPVRGGTLQLMKTQKDDGLDPAGRVVGQVWEQAKIYSWTHIYRLSTQAVELDVALSYETPDLDQVIFKFRDGVNFQPEVANGRQLVAEDYAYSIKRVPDFVKTKGGLSTPVLFDWIDTVEATEKLTAVVKQKRAFFERMNALGERNPFAIVAKEVIDANGGAADNTPAGSGPYLLTKRDDTGTRLERWPGYFKRDKDYPGFPKDGPYIDVIDSKILADPAAQTTGFLNGQFDIYAGATVIDRLNLDQFKNAKGVVVQEVANTANYYIVLDMLRFTDPRAREAIVRAIDWEAFISTVLVGNGRYQGHINGSFKDLALPQSELQEFYKFDPAAAKQLWQAAGDPFDGKLRAIEPAAGPLLTFMEFFKGQLEQNLDVTVTIDASTSFVTKAVAPNPKEWDLFVSSASSFGNGLPEGNALQVATPNGYGPAWNFVTNAPNSEVASAAQHVLELYQQEQGAADKATRTAKIQELDRYLLTNVLPVIPLPVQDTNYIAYQDRLQNYPYVDTATFYPVRANDWWIA